MKQEILLANRSRQAGETWRQQEAFVNMPPEFGLTICYATICCATIYVYRFWRGSLSSRLLNSIDISSVLPLDSLLKTLSFAKNWCLFAIHCCHRSVEALLTHIIFSKCIWTMTTLFFIFMFMMSGMRRLVFSMSAVGSVDFVGSTHHRHCECRFTTLGVKGGRKEWVWWTWLLWFVRWSDW